MTGNFKKITALILTAVLVISVLPDVSQESNEDTQIQAAESLGSLADTVTGTWSYEGDSGTVTQTNAMLLDDLPTLANKGTTRFTTDNYDSSNGAFLTNGWSTSLSWNYSNSTNFGNSTYAIPLAYKADSDGVWISKPSNMTYSDTYYSDMPEDGSLSDFKVLTDYTSTEALVDVETDWSTEFILENSEDSSQYMRTTMVQGSPVALFEMNGTNTATISRTRELPSTVVGYNGDTPEESTMIVIEVFDNHNDAHGYPNYQYYAVYVPEGTEWSPISGTVNTWEMPVTLPEDNTYFAIAYLSEASGSTASSEAAAVEIAEEYAPYVFNKVTDTYVTYEYNTSESTVVTEYHYAYEKLDDSAEDGVIMGILPSQYKNMDGYDYLDNEARTIRGQMKFLVGDSYSVTLTYSGILMSSPSVSADDYDTLQSYIDEFMEDYGVDGDGKLNEDDLDINTYDSGKRLNRAVQVMEAAETIGDTETAETLLNAIEIELADWFTCDNDSNAEDKYFYYDEDVGALFGFPQAYYTVDGMTDHQFHYGYFIEAAAQVAFRDPDFIASYSDIIDELINDIACDEENSADSRYPYLRSFSTYEGHSWASGHANFADGNNLESSSESINAWAALILYGQATGDEELTELGVYLYTTETNSVYNYEFDIDGDVLDGLYTGSSSTTNTRSVASIIWGGKYDYSTWWTDEPLQIQGINLLPITAASYYLAKDEDFIWENYNTAIANEAASSSSDKLDDPYDRWNELWSSYIALADTDEAISYFDDECDPEAGDSKAHAYHYIMSLAKAGSPNLDITSDCPISMVFEKDGVRTYVAYNASSEAITVTFSDGVTMSVEANTQEEYTADSYEYTIEHYTENDDGTYSLYATETKSASEGASVTAASKTISGYIYDETIDGTVSSGTVTADGSLVLKLYYRLRTEEDGTEEPTTTTAAVTLVDWSSITDWIEIEGTGADELYYCVIEGSSMFNRVNVGTGIFYLVVNAGDFTATLTGPDTGTVVTKSCPGAEVAVYTSEVSEEGYYTVEAVVNEVSVVIALKKGSPEITTTAETVTTTTTTTTTATTTSASTTTATTTTAAAATTAATTTTASYATTAEVSSQAEETTAAGDDNETTLQESTEQAEETTAAASEENTTLNTEETKTTETTAEGVSTGESSSAGSVATGTSSAVSSKANLKLVRAKIKKAKRLKKKKRSIKITLKKMKDADGYIVQYSTSKKFKKAKTKTVTSTSRKLTIKKTKKKKNYYVRARAYIKINNVKIVGAWSKTKKVKKVKKK